MTIKPPPTNYTLSDLANADLFYECSKALGAMYRTTSILVVDTLCSEVQGYINCLCDFGYITFDNAQHLIDELMCVVYSLHDDLQISPTTYPF